jgi:uncharacterized protein (DUF2236 family)
MALVERDEPLVRSNGADMGPSAAAGATERPAESAPVADDWALGPGSVTWRVLDDPAVFLIGLLREALLLTLHPPFAAAAFDHDSFGDDPVMRFRRIAMYTYGTTYGTKADAERYSSIVRRRHDQIVGVEPITGLRYQANAEYENTLTQVMLGDSFLAAYETLHGPLSGAERDQFVREQQLPAALLGVNPDHMPDTYGQSIDFLAHARQHFATGIQARETLGPFGRERYPRGTVIGDLPWPRRAGAMFAVRLFGDMALAIMRPEERRLVAIDRRPKLGSRSAVLASYRALSAFLRSPRGVALWEGFVHENVAGILRRARAAEQAHGARTRRATFEVPDPRPSFVALPELERNWPGSTSDYRLGRPTRD